MTSISFNDATSTTTNLKLPSDEKDALEEFLRRDENDKKRRLLLFYFWAAKEKSYTGPQYDGELAERIPSLSLIQTLSLSLSLSLLSLFLPGFCSRIAFTKFNSSSPSLSLVSDSHVEVLSLSSGVGTSSQSGSAGSATTPTTEIQRSLILPGMHVVCLENHSSGEPGSLHITQGDIIEGKTELGLSYSPSKLGCFTL